MNHCYSLQSNSIWNSCHESSFQDVSPPAK